MESELGISLGWTKYTDSVSGEEFLGTIEGIKNRDKCAIKEDEEESTIESENQSNE